MKYIYSEYIKENNLEIKKNRKTKAPRSASPIRPGSSRTPLSLSLLSLNSVWAPSSPTIRLPPTRYSKSSCTLNIEDQTVRVCDKNCTYGYGYGTKSPPIG